MQASAGYPADERRSVRLEESALQEADRQDARGAASMTMSSAASGYSARSSGSELSEAPTRGPSLKSIDRKDKREGTLSFSTQAFIRENVNVKVSSRYQVDEKEFASGGNGKVYFGRDKTLGDRKVVIKKVVCNDDDKLVQFRREVEIMKTLKHPNVCKLFETYEEGRFMYIVMELCEGGELFDQIADAGNITEHVAADVIGQVSSALNYAHGLNIAHRDLKPENVCLASKDPNDHNVKVIDWGLGFFFGGALRMKSAVGSLAYAAPEVLQAEETSSYTEACDLWSLGAMAYVMLCGRPPFWGSIANQLNKMMAESYPLHSPPWDTISADAKNFIKSLLKKDAGARLPIQEVVDHPWLRNARRASQAGDEATASILWNVRMFHNNSEFLKVCMGAAAVNLDCRSLQGIQQVFKRLDANSDGCIDMAELKNGFAQIYGQDSDEAKNIASTFESLDMDGSGRIDYDEFCAVALGEKMLEQENCLWAAFKAFDVHGDDGKVTREEIVEVLKRGDVRSMWSEQVCDEVAQEIMELFDRDKRGYLDFESWLRMMRGVAWPESSGPPNSSTLGFAPSAASGSSLAPRRPMVAWVSLDPRTGDVQAYPPKIAMLVEASYQRKEENIFLGEAFFNSRVCFKGAENGLPFQRTPKGLRDVRRLDVLPETVELELRIGGPKGEYRFADDGQLLKRTSGIVAAAFDPQSVDSSATPQKQSRASRAWSLDDLADSLPQSISAVRRLLWGGQNCPTSPAHGDSGSLTTTTV